LDTDTDAIKLQPFFVKFGLLLLMLFILTRYLDAKEATHYHYDYIGLPMALDEIPYDPTKMTCASWEYPLGTMLLVTYQGKSVLVKVTDRHSTNHKPTPAESLTDIDLSFQAFVDLLDAWDNEGRLYGVEIKELYENIQTDPTINHREFSLSPRKRPPTVSRRSPLSE
jgi:hypothetical protein|tara:strand:- start:18383 stop:18886 length:504 start_codon:yes stop_codon:yes gene_type:complete